MNSLVPGGNSLSALGQSGDFVGPLQQEAGPLSALRGFFTNDAGKPAWGKIAGAAIGGLGLLNSMKPDQPEAVAPSMPEGWNDPLPELDFNRNQLSMDDYRNYGRKTGEHQFFDPNALPSSSPRVLGNLPPMSFEPPAEQLPGRAIYDLAAEQALRQQRGFAMGGSTSSNFVRGPGTGRSDEIEALLSDGEYVIDAESVALLGDGSLEAGAKRLDEMRENLRKHKGSALAKGKFSPDAKTPEQYMGLAKAKGGRVRYPGRIWDIHNKEWVGQTYADSRRARTRAEKLNLEYGAHRYVVLDPSREPVKKAKGGRIRGDWVQRVVEGGKGKGADGMTAEQRAELKSIQDFMADYRHMVEKKHKPDLKVVKAKGGAVKDLTKLANKFEAMVTGGNEIRARQIARRLDSLAPGSSSFLREGFAKGGKVIDLLKEFGNRHKSQSPEQLHLVAEELRKLKPDSEVLRQYDAAQRRKGKSVKTIGED